MRDTSGGAATGVPWTVVRDAAVGAVRRGWPVVPGVYRMDALGFPELVPLENTGDLTPITDSEHAQEIWTRLRPPGVLLVCGKGIDALEVPPWASERLPALAEHGLRVPIATTVAPYRWLLLVATGSRRLRPELAAAAVLLHSTGEWAALPPTTLPGNPPLRWTQPPAENRTLRLPKADEVQRILVGTRRSRRPRGFRATAR
ncbi:MAG: bifunctional DNA primase/polymerase [Pseudonocardiales bacterium]|nr:bifunctional DNA primase/polymerase [Pseudonocardiales bacterium]